MTEGSISIVSPEDGDGETYYFEVTRYGEIWDGRAETKEEAEDAADVLLTLLIQKQDETGRNHEAPLRHAVLRGLGHDKLETIRRYLPSNYTADSDGGNIWIHGVDNAGWTLDRYVIPRLQSGLYFAEEVTR